MEEGILTLNTQRTRPNLTLFFRLLALCLSYLTSVFHESVNARWIVGSVYFTCNVHCLPLFSKDTRRELRLSGKLLSTMTRDRAARESEKVYTDLEK